jgi:hypothetical protein
MKHAARQHRRGKGEGVETLSRSVARYPERRRGDRPDHSPIGQLRRLQQTIGNRAVQRLLAGRDRPGHPARASLSSRITPLAGAVSSPEALGLGSGVPLSQPALRRYEAGFGWNFAGVRLHSGPEAHRAADAAGALAFARGRHIVFGSKIGEPEAPTHAATLAHELAHVVQQQKGGAETVQAVPRVTAVTPSALELGVGGRTITATATVAAGAPASPPLVWSVNPGGAAPAGVIVTGTGRRVTIRSAQPGPGVNIGGTPITLRAALAATPGDFADSAPVMLVQVTQLAYAAAPPLAPIASLIAGAPPVNTGEPNRDGITGNTVLVTPTTAPAGRPNQRITLRRSLGAGVAGLTITPGAATGNLQLTVTDVATGARFDEATPSTAGGAPLMAEFTINSVPTRANALAFVNALGPYGALNQFGWAASDASGAGGRIIGEIMSLQENSLGLNLAGPGGWNAPTGFNAGIPNLQLAVPAAAWQDQVVAGSAGLTPAGVQAIDVNRFVGPGAPGLPRSLTTGQAFVYFSWAGGGAVFSRIFDRGAQHRTLVNDGPNGFVTDQVFPGARVRRSEAYVGNPLINFTGFALGGFTPAGATALAADGFATANMAVNATSTTGAAIPGRLISWSVLAGPVNLPAGATPSPPGAVLVQAGLRPGTARLRGADSVHPNRQVGANVPVVAVQLRGMAAAPGVVAAGVVATVVNVNAVPGGRTLQWVVDGRAMSAGVRVVANPPGPAPAQSATVTRPAAFIGAVTVTATDSVLPAATASTTVRFR